MIQCDAREKERKGKRPDGRSIIESFVSANRLSDDAITINPFSSETSAHLETRQLEPTDEGVIGDDRLYGAKEVVVVAVLERG